MVYKYYVIKIIEDDKELVEAFLIQNEAEFADYFEINKEKYNKIKE